jgi:hypothetical protein
MRWIAAASLVRTEGPDAPGPLTSRPPMSSVTVLDHTTLDGVMQAPGRADEDTRDGFPYGGGTACPCVAYRST